MKMLNKKQRVKGFTLTEMIVVIAIITVLTAILTPTMTTYFWKSRVKTANSNAKMVYNAAQSAVQRYVSIDRTAGEKSLFYDKSEIIISYSGESGSFTYSVTDGAGGSGDECVERVVNYVNRVVSNAEQQDWCIYVDKYIVKACVLANNAGTDNVGYYSVGTIGVEKVNKIDGVGYGSNYANAHEALLKAKAASY